MLLYNRYLYDKHIFNSSKSKYICSNDGVLKRVQLSEDTAVTKRGLLRVVQLSEVTAVTKLGLLMVVLLSEDRTVTKVEVLK